MSVAFKFTNENFNTKSQEGVVLVDFWASWCGPCQAMNPIIEELSNKYKNKVTVGKLNVDENQSIAKTFGVRSIPTILILKDGKVMETQVGATSLNDLENKIKKYI